MLNESVELNELDSAQWSKGIKHELLTKSRNAHQAAKDKKGYKDFAKKKTEVVKDKRGIRALHKGKWGYMKDRKFTADK